MRLVIEIPDDQVAELARLIAAHLADSGRPPAQPARPDRPDRARSVAGSQLPVAGETDPAGNRELATGNCSGPPTDGRSLLGWADRHGLRAAVLKLGRARRYPSKVLTWSAEQVADVVHELGSKPPKGSQTWGGAAGSGRVMPK